MFGESKAKKAQEDGNEDDIMQKLMKTIGEKRKNLGADESLPISPEEIAEALAEILEGEESDQKNDGESDEEKADENEDEEQKNDGGENEDGQKKAPSKIKNTKSNQHNPSKISRKYSDIFLAAPASKKNSGTKKIPPDIQLARAVKCLDVFGRRDPEAAAYHAKKKYDDDEMAREFKTLSATNPMTGGYLIPEIYLNEIIGLLYSKTVVFELGAQKLPMSNGILNIPKMITGSRATWGGEQRKIKTSSPTFGNIKLFAKRMEAIVPQTRELLMSSNYSADQMFANDLIEKMYLGLDYGALFGIGGDFQPTGLAVNKSVEKIDCKNFSPPPTTETGIVGDGTITADFPVFIRSTVLSKNVSNNKMGWAMNNRLEGVFMNMKTTTGTYIYRDEMNSGKLLGFPYKISNQIETDNNGFTSMFFGNWSDLIIGEQLGLETYTTLDGTWTDENGIQHNAFEENLSATRALMYVDVAPIYTESFIYCKNIKVM